MEAEASPPALARATVLEQAWQLLQDGQPRAAKEIAAALVRQGLAGLDKSLVNSVLAREGKGTFVYDRALYTYALADPNAGPPTVDETAAPPEPRSGPAPPPAGPPADRAVVLAATQALLADRVPRTSRQIAAELIKGGIAGVDKSLINSILAREGKDVFVYDRAAYTYMLVH